MFETSLIEISESALRKNIRFLKNQIGSDVLFSSVIKGNAYGHGIEQWVPLAEKCGIRHFATFSADEAFRANENRTGDSSVMITGCIDNEDLSWAIENGVSYYLFDFDRLEQTLRIAKRLNRPARVHLELETGLQRTGFETEHLAKLTEILLAHSEQLDIEGVCTHFAGAESIANFHRIQNQIQRFNDMLQQLKARGVRWRYRHAACSAAALNYPETHLDMVRIGIAHYGFWPSKEIWMNYQLNNPTPEGKRRVDPLRRVMRWSSRIMSLKTVPAGEFIGYGTTYQTSRRQRIASVPVGYFHGFSRALSNLGHVLVNGRRAGVTGLVNMNMIMVDVTDIPDVKKGDEVVLIGRQKKNQVTVSSFSDLTRYLNYEVLVRLPSEIPRVIVK